MGLLLPRLSLLRFRESRNRESQVVPIELVRPQHTMTLPACQTWLVAEERNSRDHAHCLDID